MTWTRPAFAALSALFMIVVVVQFFLGGLLTFSGHTDGLELHRQIGYPVLHTIPILMIIVAALGKMGKKIIGMSIGLLILVGIQPVWVTVDTEETWVHAIHVPFALAIAFLAHHIMRAAMAAYRESKTA